MRMQSILLLAVLAGSANSQVVSVSPSCPRWENSAVPGQPSIAPTITIRYHPQAPEARLQAARALNVVYASAAGINRFESETIPLLRSEDGSWQVSFRPKKNYFPGYSIFFFQDDKGHVDNNRNSYWEVLGCHGSEVDPYAVDMQALTYEGKLLAPGIQRAPDLARAVEIIKADLQARPQAANHYPFLLDLELKKGGSTPAAYEQAGNDLDAFLDAHSTDVRAMQQLAGFVSGFQKRLPAKVVERFRAALTALPAVAPRVQPNVTRILADFDFLSMDPTEPADPRQRAERFLNFAASHPTSTNVFGAYQLAFRALAGTGDSTEVEAVFEKWKAVNAPEVLPLLEMAQFYIEHKTKPERALALLNEAEKIYTESENPSSNRHFHREPGKLESLRGQAHLLLQDLAAARVEFEAAWKASPDNPEIALALGQLCEQMGDNKRALEVYLEGAGTPYQRDGAVNDAYQRLFAAQRLGSAKDAERNVAQQAAQHAAATAAEYRPLPLNRAAPEFAFTDLAGKRVDNQSAKGKPAVITFWGIWCQPCIAELPAIAEFQSRHPAANLLAVEVGDKPEKVKAFLAERNLKGLNVAVDPDWPEKFGVAAAPMSVVMDRFGQIQFVHAGRLADVEAILGKDLSALP
jgi:thiol-disulfide isomerase/thioredoxin